MTDRTKIVSCFLIAILLTGCASTSRTEKKSSNVSYAFWPQPPIEPRFQFLRSFALSTDVSHEQQTNLDRLVFGSESNQAVEINKPYGVEMRDGKIYVCDIRAFGVTILDLRKRQTRLMGVSGINRLQNPVDIAIADDGMIYVADKLRGVMVYDSGERFSTVFGHDKFQPVSVALYGDRLYVCNMAAQDIEIMDRRTGATLGTIGSIGDQDGQFRLPLGVATDSDGNIHVVDVMRCRVQKFSPDGKLLAAMGEMTDTAGNFVRPKHIAVDKDGMVYVVDAAFQNVQVFDREYRLLTSFGGAGAFPGSMNLPAGVCVTDDSLDFFQSDIHPAFDATRLILVTNQFGPMKVSAYALGGLKPGHTPQELTGSLVNMNMQNQKPPVNPLSGLDAQPPAETDSASPNAAPQAPKQE